MISGGLLKNALISGANNILKYKKHINELNIFPVPDGDTGTNMSLTMDAAVAGVKDLPETEGVASVSKKLASAMLRGARGNSGVILSLLFRGFSKGLAEVSSVEDATLIVEALEIGVKDAYGAVMKPTEGTMLTVARVASEKGREALGIDKDPVHIWDAVCEGAWKALDDTPKLLPVLKKAGVVDAGGMGICRIFEGMHSVFARGVIMESGKSDEEREREAEDFFKNAAAEFDAVINFTYCTEFIIQREDGISKNPADMRVFLEKIGDCVVVVDDEEIIKTHVHTENPGDALQYALKYGQLISVKIENMREQHKNAGIDAERTDTPKKLERVEPKEEIAFISVCAGKGISQLFKDLGCAMVVSGGQTMNPSTEDIVEAALATPAKTIFVLPNNKNIILAAEQAVPMVTDREIIVIPTKTIPQGLSAMLAFDDTEGAKGKDTMLAAAQAVSTGLVTFAARDSEFGGHEIKKGDILALKNGKLDHVYRDCVRACSRLTRSMVNKHTSFITIIYGEGITQEMAEQARAGIAAKVDDDIEITVVDGGQPVYHFIISVE